VLQKNFCEVKTRQEKSPAGLLPTQRKIFSQENHFPSKEVFPRSFKMEIYPQSFPLARIKNQFTAAEFLCCRFEYKVYIRRGRNHIELHRLNI
jgi:hypothetical protein